jgi:hypothetical protein
METAPTTSMPPAPAKPRRRWWLRLVLALATFIVTPGGVYLYLEDVARRDWEAAVAEAAQDLPRWQLMELEADRPHFAPNENAALHTIKIVSTAPRVSVAGAPTYEKVFENLPPTARLNHQQEKLIRVELAKVAKPLQEARKLKNMPNGRFPIQFSDDYIATLVPDQQDLRMLSDWLQHDAFLLAHEGKSSQAMDSCRAILNAGRSVAREPFLITYVIRLSRQRIAVETLERVLAQGTATDAHLRVMQEALDQESAECDVLYALRGERAGYHLFFEQVRAGKTDLRPYFSDASNNLPWRDQLLVMFPSQFLKDYPEYLRHMNALVEIAKLPKHERSEKFAEWDMRRTECRNSGKAIIAMFAPNVSKVYQADCGGQALLRSAMVALACERYRLAKGDWPNSLDSLVTSKMLAAIPLDPFGGQPMRYRRTKDGVVIYSIGPDLADNQGHIDRERPYDKGLDIGFRLWNVEARRQPPLPPVSEKEEDR